MNVEIFRVKRETDEHVMTKRQALIDDNDDVDDDEFERDVRGTFPRWGKRQEKRYLRFGKKNEPYLRIGKRFLGV